MPLIPNIKLKYTQLELDGKTILTDTFEFDGQDFTVNSEANLMTDFSHMDYTLYYELFDNDLVSVDFGLTVKHFDGDATVSGIVSGKKTTESIDFSAPVPLGYLRGEVGLPLTGLSVFAEGNLLAIDDSKIQDYQVGIAWEFVDTLAVDMAIRAGYRSFIIELADVDDISTDLDISGPFAGLQVHF